MQTLQSVSITISCMCSLSRSIVLSVAIFIVERLARRVVITVEFPVNNRQFICYAKRRRMKETNSHGICVAVSCSLL